MSKLTFMNKSILFIFILCVFIFRVQAQAPVNPQRIIALSGHLLDAKTGENLAGGSISVLGTNIETISDATGAFKLEFKSNATLVFKYVGYIAQSFLITNQRKLEVKLQPEVVQISEGVVVVGYGTQKRREVTGAIGSVSGSQLETHAMGDINTSLQGKIAGLQITSNSGEPGAGATVRIRGASSMSGSSQPLYIVNGVPINTETYGGGLQGDASTYSPLADINPSDIESIEVLKDGTASIYGSRASNGVIIITTKKGKGGKAPQVNISVNTGVSALTRTIGVLNGPQWRSAYIDAFFNATGTLTTKASVIDSLNPYYSKTNDWQHLLYRQAVQTKADFSISGGSKDNSINYFISAGYKDLNPLVIDTKYKQATGTAKIYYTISKVLSGSTNINISTNKYNRILTGLNNSAIYQALSTMPVYSPYDPLTGQLVQLFEGSKPNPMALAQLATNVIDRSRMFGSQDLKIQFTKDLRFTTSIGIDYTNSEETNFIPQTLLPQGQISASYLQSSKNSSWINENTLTYRHTFNKKNNFNFLAGESYQKYYSNIINVIGKGLIDAVITSINGTSVVQTYNQNIEENALLSFFGRINYDYDGKYLLSGVMRRDGSSRFGPNDRFGYFPSASAGWRFVKESFFDKLPFLSEGKIRGSYGITGNQSIGNYEWQGSIASSGTYLGNVAVTSNGVPNASLEWETTKQSNIGIDLGFWHDRIRLTGDVYVKQTTGLLFDVSVPGSTGYSTVPGNYGSLQNKGIEITLNTVNLTGKLKWSTTATFAINRNKVLSMPGNQDYRPNAFNIARVGQPVGVFYGLKSLGVYASDKDNVYRKNNATGEVLPYKQGSVNGATYKGGDVIWDDVNGDGVINDDDLQVIGNPNPKFSGGLQNEFSYKSLTLSALFTYNIGNDVFNEVKRNLDASPYDQNFSTDQLRRWKNQGDVTDVPRLVKTDPMLNYAISSRFVENGSFVRLQNVALNYRFPKGMLQRLKLTNANIGFSVANLFTWSAYTGYDPEVSSSTNALSVGVDRGSFPRSRSYNLSFNVNF